MNKTAIKNFAIWARNKLIADISYKAGLLGITEKGIKSPLPQSTQTVQFFDIGTKEPSSITGLEIQQRKKLVEEIERKAKQSDYGTAYKNVIEEVAYTWFNRLIAIRFMEVNDYLLTRIRVLSSESNVKAEPDLVTHALEANLDYSAFEKDRIIQLKQENKLDELFRMLFIKQCNMLNVNLPELFEKTSDYSELLLNVSFTDKEGVVYHLVHDIAENDFNVTKEGQVEIIGWLYQFYNTEPKDETFALLKKNVKITKERIPAATQLFTPDWIVRYMVENSLGRLWLEGHPNDELKANWKYYLDEVEQEKDVEIQLCKIRDEYRTIKPEDIKVMDPAMGSGHILVYAFDVLMQIYESHGYSQRDAAKSIVENNLFGLDIDNRAYQLAYFAVLMKARQYNRRILNGVTLNHIYSIQESNNINRNHLKYFGNNMNNFEKKLALQEMEALLGIFNNAKEYGSILNVANYNWGILHDFSNDIDVEDQLSLDTIGIEATRRHLNLLIDIGQAMTQKFDVVVTNPPYAGTRGLYGNLVNYINENYPSSKADMFSVFIEKSTKFLKNNGYCSLVTPESWMFISSYNELRARILGSYSITTMTHLGYHAFDNGFGTTVFILSNKSIIGYKGSYVDLTKYDDNLDVWLLKLIKGNKRNFVSQSTFFKLPGSPIAYWVTQEVISAFNKQSISDFGRTRQGMATSDNNRFLRFWYEVENNDINFNANNANNFDFKWVPYNKGGGFRKWYGTAAHIVNWENDGKEIKEYAASLYGSYTRTIKNINEYFKEAIAWPYITSGDRFGARFQPEGFIFDVAGSSLFTSGKYKYYLCGLLSSKLAVEFLRIINPTMNYQVGDIAKIPVVYDDERATTINELVKENISIAKADWDSYETSWDFIRHPLIDKSPGIKQSFERWKQICDCRFTMLKSNEERLNSIFFNVYNLMDQFSTEIDDDLITISRANYEKDIRSFISYSVGCMFGRYGLDVDGVMYAGGNWRGEEFKKYIPDNDNVLPITDEEYLKDDIVGRFFEFIKIAYGVESFEENLDFIANALNKKGSNSREIIRNYFIKDFYKDHCQVYQKRPIYWLFDSGKKNGFKALIYMHRYDENTIGNLRIDYLHRIQRIYENEIARMQDTIENSKDAREIASATKRKEKLIKQLQETKEYDEKIAHLALARISIDLDDGVKVNYEKIQTDRDGKKYDVLAKI